MSLLTTREVLACTKLSRAQLYRLRDRDRFPAPIKLAANAIAYKQDDVERWIQANISPRFHFDDRRP